MVTTRDATASKNARIGIGILLVYKSPQCPTLHWAVILHHFYLSTLRPTILKDVRVGYWSLQLYLKLLTFWVPKPGDQIVLLILAKIKFKEGTININNNINLQTEFHLLWLYFKATLFQLFFVSVVSINPLGITIFAWHLHNSSMKLFHLARTNTFHNELTPSG